MRNRNYFLKTATLILSLFILFSGNAYAYSSAEQFLTLNDNQVHSGKVIPSADSNAVFQAQLNMTVWQIFHSKAVFLSLVIPFLCS